MKKVRIFKMSAIMQMQMMDDYYDNKQRREAREKANA